MAPHLLSILPRPVSHFLGYRAPGTQAPVVEPAPLKKALTLTISLTFAFAALSVIQSVFRYDTAFTDRHLPGIITSYGATSVLVFGMPAAPLAQPRAVIFGHFFSGLTGVIIYNLWNLMPAEQFAATNWLGGSLAAAIALVVMDLTGTTHPPAGATAILPVVQADIQALNWNLLWILLLSSTLMVGVGLISNNILGRYPTFWIQPGPLPWDKGETKEETKQEKDTHEPKAVEKRSTTDLNHSREQEQQSSSSSNASFRTNVDGRDNAKTGDDTE